MMNPMQKSYSSFVESVCKQFGCTDAIRPLQEGFSALCEADTGDTGNGSPRYLPVSALLPEPRRRWTRNSGSLA